MLWGFRCLGFRVQGFGVRGFKVCAFRGWGLGFAGSDFRGCGRVGTQGVLLRLDTFLYSDHRWNILQPPAVVGLKYFRARKA